MPRHTESAERRRDQGGGFPSVEMPVPAALSRSLLRVTAPFLVTVTLLVVLGAVSVDTLSAARAFVGGESHWAKGQKEASHALNRYVWTYEESDYQQFLANIAVPMGDRIARLELDRARPDPARVAAGFIQGRNHPDDVAGMTRLYRRFHGIGFMSHAIGLWAGGDDLIVELADVAEQLHRRTEHRDVGVESESARVALIERANAIDQQLGPMQEAFSEALGEASRRTEMILMSTMLSLAGVLVVLAIGVSRRMLMRTAQVERALRISEERLNLAVTGSNDGLWDWNMRTGESYCSPRTYELLDYAPGGFDARVDIFFDNLHPDDLPIYRTAMRAHLRDHAPYQVELRLRVQRGDYRWFLVRGQAVRDADGRAVRIAGSIKDITDRKLADAAISRHAMQQELIADFGQLALGNPDIDELLARAVVVVGLGLEPEFCRLLAIGSDDDTLLLKGAAGWQADWATHRHFDRAAETENRFVIGVREALIIDDFAAESRYRPSAMLVAHGVRSAAEMLICGAHGSYGVLGIYARERARFTQESINFLHGITNTVASAWDRKVAEERLTHMAQFDPLTGLPNRQLYLDRLWQTVSQAARDRVSAGVLFVDLDRFKIVNDTLGHGAGDDLLLQVAQRLQTCLRASDTVGRLGGDEFAVALANLLNAEDAGAVAQKIVESLSMPFKIDGQDVYVSASIGISIYPTDGAEPDVLLKNADTAMYRAKESGRNNHQFYLSAMNERVLERLKIETQLRGALARGEFRLHYQPKANLATGAISGFEALLRWQHPERGLVPPIEFIGILEDTGLIIPVGEWVVSQTCAQIQLWRAAGLPLRPVAVNLSARQFHQKNLDAVIGRILQASGVPPHLLEFELTESMLMSDSEAAVQTLRNMKAYGVRLSVDDFGTGYSSLAYLKRFPLDALKIDRAFIRDVTTDPDDATIATAIIHLAHSLKLKVIAEGVETRAQLDFLRAHGCDEVQGYYFARPMLPEDCTVALREGRCLRLATVVDDAVGVAPQAEWA